LPGDDEPLVGELLEVLCINCQDFIALDDIEAHSRNCMQVRPEVLRVEAGGQLEGVKLRVTKLYNYLFSVSTGGDVSPGDKNYLLIMQRLCGRLISITGLAHKSENTECLQGLESLTLHVKRNAHLTIYVERLRALAREQRTVLQELELESKQPKDMTLEEQLEFFKNKSQILEDALKLARAQFSSPQNAVEDINSDTNSRISDASSFLGSADATREFETDELESPRDEIVEIDDEQKLFYSKCLAVKLALSAQYAVQSVPIQSIYAKAKATKVSMQNWDRFIREEILSRTRGRENTRGGLRRRFQ
jgi:hypothetical protein